MSTTTIRALAFTTIFLFHHTGGECADVVHEGALVLILGEVATGRLLSSRGQGFITPLQIVNADLVCDDECDTVEFHNLG